MLCSTALECGAYYTLMAGKLAQFVLTDGPYNLSRKTISSNENLEDFQFGAGEMLPHEFTRFWTTAMCHIQAVYEDGSLQAYFMSYHFLLELLRAGTIVFGRPKAIVTWVKSQAGQGGCSDHKPSSSPTSRTATRLIATTSISAAGVAIGRMPGTSKA